MHTVISILLKMKQSLLDWSGILSQIDLTLIFQVI